MKHKTIKHVELKDKDRDNISFYLTVDYESFKPSTYNGVTIHKSINHETSRDIIRVNTGDIETDVDIAMDAIYHLEGEARVSFLSSYDDYMSDLQAEKEGRLEQLVKDVEESNRKMDKALEDYKKELGKDELTLAETNYILNKCLHED